MIYHGGSMQSIQKLKRIFNSLLYQKRARFNRILPLNEYLNDRWKKAKLLGWGHASSCYDTVYIFGDVSVGEHTFVGPFCVLDGSAKLTIGSYCSISAGVHIYTHNSVAWATSKGHAPYELAPVSIGDGCYIGPYSIIAQGITIGDGAIIGAHSFVNCNIPAGAKVAGIPAKVLYKQKSAGGGGRTKFFFIVRPLAHTAQETFYNLLQSFNSMCPLHAYDVQSKGAL